MWQRVKANGRGKPVALKERLEELGKGSPWYTMRTVGEQPKGGSVRLSDKSFPGELSKTRSGSETGDPKPSSTWCRGGQRKGQKEIRA